MKSFRLLILFLPVCLTHSAAAARNGNDLDAEQECDDLTSALQLPSTRLMSRPSAFPQVKLALAEEAGITAPTVAPSYQLMQERAQALLSQQVSDPATSFGAAIMGIPEDDFKKSIADARASFAEDWAMTVGLSFLATLITALMYRSCGDSRFAATDGPVDGSCDVNQEFSRWSSGTCDCLERPGICCWACFCPCIRWADTSSLVGILGFWVALWLFFGLVMLWLVVGGVLAWLFVAMILTSYRQQLKTKFGMEGANGGTVLGDCCLFCWCLPCTIAQEARHVDASAYQGHPAVGEAIRAKA